MALTPLSFDAAIREYSYTAGTGTYLLAGALSGCLPFSAAPEFSGGSTGTYHVTNGSPGVASGMEIATGVYNPGAKTLTRATIVASTNGGAAVNWSGKTRLIIRALVPGGPAVPVAVVCPTPPLDGQVLIWSVMDNAYCPVDFCALVAACLMPPPTCLPFIVYSNRKVVPAYAGALYTIRRSSDNATMAFSPDMSGNSPDAAIATFLGASTATVPLWNDQSGNGYNAVSDIQPQIWGGDPTWLASQIGGRPALQFSNELEMSTPARGLSARSVNFTTAKWTIFIVAKHEAFTDFAPYPNVDSTQCMLGINNGSGDSGADFRVQFSVAPNPGPPTGMAVVLRADDSTFTFRHAEDILSPGVAGLMDNYQLLEFAWDGNPANTVMKADRADLTPIFDNNFNGTDFPVVGDMAIGANTASTFLNAQFVGRIAEIQIYNCVLTSAERTTIRNSAAAYYGITLS